VVVVPWESPLVEGIFLKRYKRFFADIAINGQLVVAHVANTGSLKGVLKEGVKALVLSTQDPSRKLKYSLKAIQSEDGKWVGVDTRIPSRLFAQVLQEKPDLIASGVKTFKLEHKLNGQTRLDALLTLNDNSQIYVELKNVTMGQFDPELKLQTAYFPDSITERGQKHIIELEKLVSKGHRAKLIFMVQRVDCFAFRPATQIDPIYSQLLFEAHKNGVEISAYKIEVTPQQVSFLNQKLPIHF